jgi:tetratricopeptide (TPR) repeat protein
MLGDRRDNLEKAIEHCNNALNCDAIASESASDMRTNALLNLANAYGLRIAGNPKDNQQKALEYYNTAIAAVNKEEFPEEWADVHMSIAGMYSQHMSPTDDISLDAAIHHYNLSLEVYTKEDFPEEFADAQMYLSNLLCQRTGGVRRENLERALRHYESLVDLSIEESFLEVPTPMDLVVKGTGFKEYCRLQEESIARESECVRRLTKESFPVKWALAHLRLGDAFAQRVSGDRNENLEQGIKHMLVGQQVFVRSQFPEHWLWIQSSLCGMYLLRIAGDRRGNLRKAKQYLVGLVEAFVGED